MDAIGPILLLVGLLIAAGVLGGVWGVIALVLILVGASWC